MGSTGPDLDYKGPRQRRHRPRCAKRTVLGQLRSEPCDLPILPLILPRKRRRPPGRNAGLARKSGAEALIRLRDGRFIVIAESVDDGTHHALLFSGDPVEKGSVVSRFTYRPPDGYRVTDGVQLADGRLALIHRSIGLPGRFCGRRSPASASLIAKGKVVESRIIATLTSPLLVDNLRGSPPKKKVETLHIWL